MWPSVAIFSFIIPGFMSQREHSFGSIFRHSTAPQLYELPSPSVTHTKRHRIMFQLVYNFPLFNQCLMSTAASCQGTSVSLQVLQ